MAGAISHGTPAEHATAAVTGSHPTAVCSSSSLYQQEQGSGGENSRIMLAHAGSSQQQPAADQALDMAALPAWSHRPSVEDHLTNPSPLQRNAPVSPPLEAIAQVSNSHDVLLDTRPAAADLHRSVPGAGTNPSADGAPDPESEFIPPPPQTSRLLAGGLSASPRRSVFMHSVSAMPAGNSPLQVSTLTAESSKFSDFAWGNSITSQMHPNC